MISENTMQQNTRKKRLTAPEVMQLQVLCRERLLADLLAQDANPGAPIAGERILCQRYDIPLSVLRSTLAELKNDGTIVSAPRSGMRLAVKPRIPKSLINANFAFIGYIQENNPRSRTTRPAVICAGLERILNEQGGQIQFFNVWGVKNFQSIADEIIKRKVDAILYIGNNHTSSGEELRILSEIGIPMISIETETVLCDTIYFDNVQIGQTAAAHILDLGHRDVCVLGFPEHNWSNIRVQSICSEFLKRGAKEPHIYEFSFHLKAADINEFIRSKATLYSACIAVNDYLGCKVLSAARGYGILVPEDLSIMGADDLLDNRHFNLTTVQLSDMELGRTAYTLLKEKFLNPQISRKSESHLLTCPLVVRNTTGQYQKSNQKVS
ncbi:MAG: substrate-binding domain-containing protein [Victivallales bacterium]|jgi:DNA-binding LacI/PurR family transcriptional regulator